jgi:hypothetical protein
MVARTADQRITDLAHRLGAADNLGGAELAVIQQQVDKIAATVPEDKKPHYDEGVSVEPLWGASLAVVGGFMVVSSVAWFRFGVRRLYRR